MTDRAPAPKRRALVGAAALILACALVVPASAAVGASAGARDVATLSSIGDAAMGPLMDAWQKASTAPG